MAEIMFAKYNKYWGAYKDMNSALFFAQLLDPREKEKGLEFTLECLYERNQYQVARVMKKVKEDMVRPFEEYKSSYDVVGESSTSGVAVAEAPVVAQEQIIVAMLNSRKKRHKRNPLGVEGLNELEKYLLEEFDEEEGVTKFDILAWWKSNSTKYKVLSHMAKDILAMPVSYVASESAFSTGKRVLSTWRSSLSPRTVESLLCTQGWLEKPIALGLLSEYIPDDFSSIEEEEFDDPMMLD
ncbi:zinc finger BED domain-containing protein RICESLEEPER 3-like isoform X2 [Papaver somniferum]|uniref:zinc finger BED domain-containing protein RICESLEEPER 3-like isoform X2 n=1 Tax=Papaver somniferum TaxID=3469 RepID=UPI000E7035FF|nr:zinc finger BED domain-containing protein RICESLEEPER 3-like isoform X2 [Papaver somniferum]